MTERYYGKYRGTVVNNIDPMLQGRVLVMVPDVSGGMISSWAMPCLPFGGDMMGMFALPKIGAGVWVEYEHGDSDFPIWTGCFWGNATELPSEAKLIPPGFSGVVLQTTMGSSIVINDLPGPLGGISIKLASGASIVVNDLEIKIDNGRGASIALTGPKVSVNNGALEII